MQSSFCHLHYTFLPQLSVSGKLSNLREVTQNKWRKKSHVLLRYHGYTLSSLSEQVKLTLYRVLGVSPSY